MKDLRILFMGTPEFAVATLALLLENNYNIVGVITAPDRPAGRGRRLKASAVKSFAHKKGLKILQPPNLKAAEFLDELTALNANLQIVVAFRMLPRVVWSMPEYGTFNLHASLLPQYRGAAPINWAIINGEEETGVTTFFIDDKIDTGEIILQEKTAIATEDSAGSLHDKLMILGAAVVLKTVKLIENDQAITRLQEHKEEVILKTAHKIHKETCKINWQDSATDIHNLIRGLSPYPTAWTTLVDEDEKMNIKVYTSEIEFARHKHKSGNIFLVNKELKVAVKEGYILLKELQLPGKRRIAIKDAINGLKLSKIAHMV